MFSGPLTASMISAARCFVQPSFKIASILRAVLRDEMIAWNKKNGSGAVHGQGSGEFCKTKSYIRKKWEQFEEKFDFTLIWQTFFYFFFI